MVECCAGQLDRTFHALAHPVRRQILTRLATGHATVLDIAAGFDISLNGVSKHLKVLEQAGLIAREVRGREHRCTLRTQPLQEAGAWIAYYRPYWEDRLTALEQFLSARASAED